MGDDPSVGYSEDGQKKVILQSKAKRDPNLEKIKEHLINHGISDDELYNATKKRKNKRSEEHTSELQSH